MIRTALPARMIHPILFITPPAIPPPSTGAIVTVMPSAVTGFPPFTNGFGSEKFDSHNSILSAGTPAVYCFDTDYIRHERDVFSKIFGVFGKILTIFENFSAVCNQ